MCLKSSCGMLNPLVDQFLARESSHSDNLIESCEIEAHSSFAIFLLNILDREPQLSYLPLLAF